jgi:hypothetical protein
MSRAAIDERGFEMVRRIRREHGNLSLADFKALVREQFSMLLLDQDAAVAAIPSILPADMKARREGVELINQVLGALGPLSAEDQERVKRITRLFEEGASPNLSPFRKSRNEPRVRISS